MEEAWEVLVEAGLPDGPIRPAPKSPPEPEHLRAAVREIADRVGQLGPRRHDSLSAWLRAWEHHWPRRFEEVLGVAGMQCLTRLSAPADSNHYLKLRRIAIENLSGLL